MNYLTTTQRRKLILAVGLLVACASCFTIYALVPVDDPTLTDNWRYTLGALAAICWDLTAVATLLLKEHR